MDEWINKMYILHTTEYYSALEREKIPIHAVTWVKLEGILLSKINQTQKNIV